MTQVFEIIEFATVRQLDFNRRTKIACDSRAKRYVMALRTVADKRLKNRALRQCDSSKSTDANQLTQAECVSATVPYILRDCCTDCRNDQRTARPTYENEGASRGISYLLAVTDGARR